METVRTNSNELTDDENNSTQNHREVGLNEQEGNGPIYLRRQGLYKIYL